MRQLIAGLLIFIVMVMPVKITAQQPVTKDRNETLKYTGYTLGVIGVLMVIPSGTTYRVLGDSYCVDTYSVDAGRCGLDTRVLRLGLALVGTGVLFVYIGSRQVAIAPTRTGVGVVASVRWK